MTNKPIIKAKIDHPKGAKRFYLRWYYRNPSTKQTIFHGAGGGFRLKREAEQYFQEHRQSFHRQMLAELAINQHGLPYMLGIYDRWFNLEVKPRYTNVNTLANYKKFRTVIARYSPFEQIPLTQFKRSDYQKFINWYGKEDNSGHAKDSVSRLHNALYNAVQSAMYDEIIPDTNFIQGIKLVWNDDKKRTTGTLELADFKTFTQANMQSLDPIFPGRYMIMLACYTGLRKEEVQGLTWDKIDFDRHQIIIEQTYHDVNQQLDPHTKTTKSRRVVNGIPNHVFEHLKELEINHQPFVFANQAGRIPESNALTKLIRRTLAKCGIETSHITFQSIRRAVSAYLTSNGLTPEQIARHLGNSPYVLAKHYLYDNDFEQEKRRDQIITANEKL